MYKIINIIAKCVRKLIQLINYNNRNKFNKENNFTEEEKKQKNSERNRYGFPIR